MSDKIMNSGSHWLSIRERNFAKITLAILSFSAVCISLDCLAQAAPLPRPEISLYAIHLNNGWDMGTWSRWIHMRYQLLSHRYDGSVELKPLITSDIDAVPEEKSKEKRKAVEQKRVDTANEREDLFHVLFPAIVWFLLGLAFGGAFSRPNSQSRVSSSLKPSGEPS